MREALKEAEIALNEGNWPIGCVIELDGEIVSRAHNESYSEENRLAHAEMLALQKVHGLLRNREHDATLYTTYEPCPMCFGAIILTRVKRVVCGIDLDNSGAMYLYDNLPLLFKQEKFKIEFTRGVLADQCAEIFMKGDPIKKLNDTGLEWRTRNEKERT